jgi:hypothetical protein
METDRARKSQGLSSKNLGLFSIAKSIAGTRFTAKNKK